MKLLALIEELRYENTSGGIVNYNLVKALGAAGHTVDVVAIEGFPEAFKQHWQYGTVETLPAKPYTVLDKLLLKIPKLRALPTWLTGFSLFYLRRIANFQTVIREKININNSTYDGLLLMGGGASFSAHHAVAKEGIRKGVKVIGLIHDPYPPSYYPKPYEAPHTRIEQKQADHIQLFFNKADHIVFPSLRLQEWMQQFFTPYQQKAVVVPHVAGAFNFFDANAGKTNPALNFDQRKMNLLHTGTMLSGRDPAPLLEAFTLMLSRNPAAKADAVLHLWGGVARQHTAVVETYKNNPNINFEDKRVTYAESLFLQSQAFVNIIIEGNYKDSPFLPGKFSDYLSFKKNILCLSPENSEVGRLLGNAYPFVVQNGETEAIANMLEQLYQLWKADPGAEISRPDLLEYVSPENVCRMYASMLGEKATGGI